MPSMTTLGAGVTRWRERVVASYSQLHGLLDTVMADEYDWAPDEGIATVKDHLFAVSESATWLASRLRKGSVSPAPQLASRAADVRFDAIRTQLDKSYRDIANWCSSASPDDFFAPMGAEERGDAGRGFAPEDLMQHHLESAAYHRSAISLLLQLIDPARVGSSAAI